MLIQEQDYLEHYGRLGMKWYEHKYGKEDGRAKYVDKYVKTESAYVNKTSGKKIGKLQAN